MEYKISVIVPVYNVEKYIGRCLQSFVSQKPSSSKFEIILVNDGSTDGSLAEAEKFSQQLPGLKIFTKPNGGLSSARNFGLEKAMGEYIWFVDGDDWVADKSMQILEDKMNGFVDLQILEFDLIHAIEKDGGFEYKTVSNPSFLSPNVETGRSYLARHGYSLGVTVNLFQREWLQKSGLRFPEGKYSEDNLFSLQTTLLAERFYKFHAELYYYYQRSNSISHTKSEEHLKKYSEDIFSNILEMRDVASGETTAVKKKISEMMAFFQLLIFLDLFKNRKFALAKEFASKMKAEKLFPIQDPGASAPNRKFVLFRKLIHGLF